MIGTIEAISFLAFLSLFFHEPCLGFRDLFFVVFSKVLHSSSLVSSKPKETKGIKNLCISVANSGK